MVIFRAVRVEVSNIHRGERWAVERAESDGLQIIVSRYFGSLWEAHEEADRLNHQAARQTMG
jgi:hypothetical protein